ncbi:MAG: hypothetical protein KDD47_27435, partial [Acidobacteria bacterium]|nr:hypothetical protein [Acidobacteriota bacterium]
TAEERKEAGLVRLTRLGIFVWANVFLVLGAAQAIYNTFGPNSMLFFGGTGVTLYYMALTGKKIKISIDE